MCGRACAQPRGQDSHTTTHNKKKQRKKDMRLPLKVRGGAVALVGRLHARRPEQAGLHAQLGAQPPRHGALLAPASLDELGQNPRRLHRRDPGAVPAGRVAVGVVVIEAGGAAAVPERRAPRVGGVHARLALRARRATREEQQKGARDARRRDGAPRPGS